MGTQILRTEAEQYHGLALAHPVRSEQQRFHNLENILLVSRSPGRSYHCVYPLALRPLEVVVMVGLERKNC